MHKDVYIVSATRTPIGAFQGALSAVSAVELGAVAISGALKEASLPGDAVDETYMGNVLSAGIGQAPARQAAKKGGVPDATPATTVSKVCGSGLMSVVLGAKSVLLGDAGIALCGGMESMTNAPYLLPKARAGYRLGNGQLIDSLVHDGLWDPYNDFHMGNAGEMCASEYSLSREAQDAFAARSYERALAAQKSEKFSSEIAAVTVKSRKSETIVGVDEEPGRGNVEKMKKLRPAFAKDGTITAANASKLNDGAAALILASEDAVKAHGLKTIAKIKGYAGHAQAPERFTTAPVGAMKSAFSKLGMNAGDIDLFEINEAFSVVTMACATDCNLDLDKVNVHGGAVALGHPIGASGARILVTLLHAMGDRDAATGLATLCIGGGEAVAVVVERT